MNETNLTHTQYSGVEIQRWRDNQRPLPQEKQTGFEKQTCFYQKQLASLFYLKNSTSQRRIKAEAFPSLALTLE